MVEAFQFGMWLVFYGLPLAAFIWLCLRVREIAIDSRATRRQLQVIAEHLGAPVVRGSARRTTQRAPTTGQVVAPPPEG